MNLQLATDPEIRRFVWGGARVIVAPRHKTTMSPEVEVVEDDLWGVLAASPSYRKPSEPNLKTLTAAWEAESMTPGEVRWREQPRALIATVYDLDGVPRAEPEWVEQALDGLIRYARIHQIVSLGLKPLGCRFGDLTHEDFLNLLKPVLFRNRESKLPTWVIYSLTPDESPPGT